jgi:hypothetical protein
MKRRSLYALAGEFVLIETGVLVALTVEGWLNERAHRALVASYLDSLTVELQQDTLLNRVFRTLESQRARSIGLLLADVGSGVPSLAGAPNWTH